jgi:hypothetical protein
LGVYEIRECEETGAKLDFIKFETKYIGTWLDFVGSFMLPEGVNRWSVMKATGWLIVWVWLLVVMTS